MSKKLQVTNEFSFSQFGYTNQGIRWLIACLIADTVRYLHGPVTVRMRKCQAMMPLPNDYFILIKYQN